MIDCLSKRKTQQAVMSSCLSKYGEGAGFPFQIKSLEDKGARGIGRAIQAAGLVKNQAGIRPSSADSSRKAMSPVVERHFRWRRPTLLTLRIFSHGPALVGWHHQSLLGYGSRHRYGINNAH